MGGINQKLSTHHEMNSIRYESFDTCHMASQETKRIRLGLAQGVLRARHAKSWEPRNLVPGHFLSKIRTFSRNQSFNELNFNFCHGFVKTGSNEYQFHYIFT